MTFPAPSEPVEAPAQAELVEARTSYRPRRHCAGLALLEVLIAVGVFSMAAVSAYQVFSGGYRIVYRSRYASMAAAVARETLEELQQMTQPASGGWFFRAAVHDPTGATTPDDRPETLAAASHLRGWRTGGIVAGKLFQISAAILNPEGVSPEATAALDLLLKLEYPEDYKRLHRTIAFTSYLGEGERSMLGARVTVTWEEEGQEREAPAVAVFETLIVGEDRNLPPEVTP